MVASFPPPLGFAVVISDTAEDYFLRDAKTDLGRIFEGKYAGKNFPERKFPKQAHPPKAFPLGKGAGEAGPDEGAIDWPNGAGEGSR